MFYQFIIEKCRVKCSFLLTVDSGLLPAVTMDNVWTRFDLLLSIQTKNTIIDWISGQWLQMHLWPRLQWRDLPSGYQWVWGQGGHMSKWRNLSGLSQQLQGMTLHICNHKFFENFDLICFTNNNQQLHLVFNVFYQIVSLCSWLHWQHMWSGYKWLWYRKPLS